MSNWGSSSNSRRNLFGDTEDGRKQAEAHLVEQQNDVRLQELSSKVSALHRITTNIYDEVEGQNLLVDETGNSFNSFGTRFRGTTQRLTRMISVPHKRHMCYLILAIVMIFFIIYKLSLRAASANQPAPVELPQPNA
ncbi:hypothetical protein K493DRAFT_312024 [Basidiobolus meristosporus CBS 931.73]|uniref:t-SNARE coiled-coil homology domain-containing protein n=1 Tax=Basidiobolus meristosporus CBS 931.73 TaxID=1314790 RepID=A0A1Y1YX35_9FUNG|nr:hypothetical protein K493DRAFT_312024 [Basidiobolus meristosporus CBS 931.73]|eukprot:ORY02618.1 hypothetical protein K493DRAFT_312024 [Basidiobolus meristosporus CBS 931.73]